MSPELREAEKRESEVSLPSANQNSVVSQKTPNSVNSPSTTHKRSGARNFIQGSLIISLVLAALLGIGIFLFQSFLPVALVARFREEFNSTGISTLLRSDHILEFQLESPTSPYALSKTQRTALELNDIIPIDLESPQPVTVFAYESRKGEFTIVAPESVAASLNPNSVKNALSTSVDSEISSADKTSDNSYFSNLKYSGRTLTVSEALATPSFKERYTVASKQWRGGNAGWYDTLENLNEARHALSRTRFNNYASLILNSGTEKIWDKIAAGTALVQDSGITNYSSVLTENDAGEEVVANSSGTLDSSSLSGAKTPEQVYDILNSKIASVLKVTGTVGCLGMELATTISTVVKAEQTYQYLNLATGSLEAFDGAKAGLDGYGDAAQEYLDALTARDPETGKTPMESPGIMEAFTGNTITEDDAGVEATNFQSVWNKIGDFSDSVSFTANTFKACSYIKLAASGVNFATTVLSFVPVLGQATAVLHIAARTITQLALGVTIGGIASFLIPKILDVVVKNVTKNVATEWLGVEYGNAWASGANKYLSSNFQMGGGAPASEETYLAYAKTRDVVLAQEAKTERALRSPLDITSSATFLGSLAYSAVPFAFSSGLTSVVKNLGSLTKNSLSALLPTASAVAETDLIRSQGDCATQESIGVVADALSCNSYYAEDFSTMDMTPEAVVEKVAELDSRNFKTMNPDGTQEIGANSSLGRYIRVCLNRTSDPGVPDGNTANELAQEDSVIDTSGNVFLANLPLVSDLSQIAAALTDLKNAPWISGQACVNSPDNPYWEENKIYSRYVGDQRVLENSEVIATNSAATYLAQYYEAHPLDNSRAGILARYSGLEKSEVLAVLDVIDGLTILAEYHPETRSRNFSGADKSSEKLSLENLLETLKNSLDDIINRKKPQETPLTIAKYIIYDINPLATTSV